MKIDLHFQFSCRIAEFWSGRADCRATLCESSRPCASTRRTSTWLCRLSRMPSGRDNRAGKGFLGVSHGLEIESHLIGNLQTVRRNDKKVWKCILSLPIMLRLYFVYHDVMRFTNSPFDMKIVIGLSRCILTNISCRSFWFKDDLASPTLNHKPNDF